MVTLVSKHFETDRSNTVQCLSKNIVINKAWNFCEFKNLNLLDWLWAGLDRAGSGCAGSRRAGMDQNYQMDI